MAVDLALQKARAVAKRHPRELVLGADTLVVCRGKVLGKPRDGADARRILGALNGRWHRVHTGLALVQDGREAVGSATSRVRARRMPPDALAKLVGKHMDKAGAYAVQDRDDPFIEGVSGPLDNVIGFPRKEFLELLKIFDKALYRKGLSRLKRHPINFQ